MNPSALHWRLRILYFHHIDLNIFIASFVSVTGKDDCAHCWSLCAARGASFEFKLTVGQASWCLQAASADSSVIGEKWIIGESEFVVNMEGFRSPFKSLVNFANLGNRGAISPVASPKHTTPQGGKGKMVKVGHTSTLGRNINHVWDLFTKNNVRSK